MKMAPLFKPLISSALLLASVAPPAFAAARWPQFRGPNSSGAAEGAKPPIQFGPGTNLLWKIALPSGLASPCVWEDRVFLTAFESGKLFALCVGREDGRELWRREAPPSKTPEVHQISSPAVATPAADGQRVYVYYSSFGLVAYDHEGREQWRKPVPSGMVINGSGTSPTLAGGTLLLNCDQDEGESFLLAVEARSGETRWQTPRPGFIGSYTTPILWTHGAIEDVVVSGSLRVVGYNLRDGKERWTARVLTSVSVAPTPVVGDGRLYLMSRSVPANAMGTFAEFAQKNDKDKDGKVARAEAPSGLRHGGVFAGIDRNKDGFITESEWGEMMALFAKGETGLFALRAPGEGDITDTHVVWTQKRGVSGISSPLFHRDRVYVVQDGGRVSCWDAKTGQVFYEQERLGAEGEYYASPITANGRIYFASTRGTVSVIEAGDALNVVARNALGEPIMATPAIADDKLYVRSAHHLWAFGE